MGFEIIKESTSTDREIARTRDDAVMPIQEVSDVSQTIKEINDDSYTSDNKFSQIDMKARLYPIEISSIIAVDSLVALDLLQDNVSFITRSKKRLSVSENGKGRSEMVQVAQGMRDDRTGRSMWDKIGGFFGGNRQ